MTHDYDSSFLLCFGRTWVWRAPHSTTSCTKTLHSWTSWIRSHTSCCSAWLVRCSVLKRSAFACNTRMERPGFVLVFCNRKRSADGFLLLSNEFSRSMKTQSKDVIDLHFLRWKIERDSADMCYFWGAVQCSLILKSHIKLLYYYRWIFNYCWCRQWPRAATAWLMNWIYQWLRWISALSCVLPVFASLRRTLHVIRFSCSTKAAKLCFVQE